METCRGWRDGRFRHCERGEPVRTKVLIEAADDKGRSGNEEIRLHPECEGMRRCVGAAAGDPLREDWPKARLRILGAAFMDALDDAHARRQGTTDGHAAADLKLRAKDRAEEAVMLGIKALYA